jgi:methylglutaconyl-CoA hydratase
VDKLLETLRACAPEATGAAKALLRALDLGDPATTEARTAEIIARIRVGAEAQEGLASFLEKRPPRWARRS